MNLVSKNNKKWNIDSRDIIKRPTEKDYIIIVINYKANTSIIMLVQCFSSKPAFFEVKMAIIAKFNYSKV